MKKLSNITLKEWRKWLKSKGFYQSYTIGGHEVWDGDSITRPIVFQTHIDPIPAFIIKNNLRTIGVDTATFLNEV